MQIEGSNEQLSLNNLTVEVSMKDSIAVINMT